ncbi:MAG: TonB-dependent receptor [Steroidobacteraceae bacterium]
MSKIEDRGSPRTTSLSAPKLFAATMGVTLASTAASMYAGAAEVKADEDAAQLGKVSVQDEVEDNFKSDVASSPKYTAPLVDTPKSITVITEQVMQSTGATSLVEALRTTPGITLGAGEGGNPVGDRPFLRGFDAQSSTYVDGVRDIGAQSREVFNLEAIEVTKGPDGTVGGRGSAGGSLNLVSKTPKLEPFLRGSVGLGSADYKRATIDGNLPLGETTALRLNALYHDADVAGRDEVYNKRWGVAPSIAFGLGTDTPITLSHYHLQSHNLPDTGIPYDNPTYRARADVTRVLGTGRGTAVDVDYSNFYGLVDRDFYRDHADITTLRAEHRFSDALTLRNTARYSRTAQDYVWTQPDDSQGNIYYGYVWRRINTRATTVHTIADQLSLSGVFATGALQHSYAAGVEISREDGENYSYVATPGTGSGASLTGTAPNQVPNPAWSCGPNVGAPGGYNCTSLFDPNPHDPWAGTISRSPNPSSTAVANTRSLYIFDTITLTPKWLLNLGVRGDHYETETLGAIANNTRPQINYSDDMFNWQAGLVFKPAANGSIYASYATSSTPPGTTLAQGSETQGLTLTTQDLAPEENRSYELGTKWDLAGNRLAVTAALFRTETTNARITLQDGTVQMAGEKRVQGLELGASGNITDRWQVFGGYTYLDSELVRAGGSGASFGLQDGMQFPNTPKQSASLWTTFNILPNLSVGGGGNYMAKVWGSQASNKWAPSYVRWDAMANYDMSETWGFQVNVQNLTNKRYFDRAYPTHYLGIAPGRSATITANVKF